MRTQGATRALPCGSNRNGTAAPSSVSVSSRREATASAVAAPMPSGPCSMSMNSPSRTPMPPGANSARKPARYDAVNTATASAGRRPTDGRIPRASSHSAAPYPAHASALATMPTAIPPTGGAPRCSASGAVSRSSRRSTGGQSSRPTPTNDAATSSSNTTCAPGWAASIARRPVSPAMAAPVPMASTCSTTADPVAAQGATPARCAMSAIPATAHTFPGRYLPRLETVQIRAAPHPSSRWPQPESITRQATISMAYIDQTTSALNTSHPGLIRNSSGCERSASQLAVRLRAAKPTIARPTTHCARRSQRGRSELPTERLAIPALAQLGDVIRREPGPPRFPHQLGDRQPVRVLDQVQGRVAQRLRGWKREPAGPALGHHVEQAAAVPARHHGHAHHERLRSREPEALALLGEQHEIGGGEVADHVGRRDCPHEAHEGADAEPLDLALEPLALRAVAHDRERQIMPAR